MTRPVSITAFIPARYGSTRLPVKPLIDLCGKPMVQRVYEQASLARAVGSVIVLTDHEEIASVVRSFGGKVLMTPSDLPSGTDRIAYAVKTMPQVEIAVNVQGDEPLIDPRMIDDTIRPVTADASLKIATPVGKITDVSELANPGIPKVVIDNDCFALYFSRATVPHVRDAAEADWHEKHVFYKHFGLYVYRRDVLLKFSQWGPSPLEQAEKLEQLRFLEHGVRIKTILTDAASHPIDTAEDAERVRSILKRQPNERS
jgi:3-deoxy-manno-octulosonate cytidylyltransferase (CMP-KDO synthetase)